jgi:hypothetical protein
MQGHDLHRARLALENAPMTPLGHTGRDQMAPRIVVAPLVRDDRLLAG